jgi:hypothetical protein
MRPIPTGRMHRPRVLTLAVLLALLAVGVAAACGTASASQADQKLNAAIGSYNAAVDKIKSLDLKTAAAADIKSARAQLNATFKDVQKLSKQTGRDTANLLQNANDQLDKTLRDATTMSKSALVQAQAAIKSAADSLSSTVNSVWKDIKSLIP